MKKFVTVDYKTSNNEFINKYSTTRRVYSVSDNKELSMIILNDIEYFNDDFDVLVYDYIVREATRNEIITYIEEEASKEELILLVENLLNL